MTSEQPKLVDPGVAEIPLSAAPEEELGGSPVVPEKPSYHTRAVAARRRAGLDVESAPRQSRGVGVRADNVIAVDDDGEEETVDIPAPEAPPLSIKIEHEDIPQDSETDAPALRRSTRNRVQRQLFSPRTKGQYHKAVGFAESGGSSRSVDHQDEESILPPSTEELNIARNEDVAQYECESDLIGNEDLFKKLRHLENIRALRGNSRGVKDQGVGHPPRARVKEDQEKTALVNSCHGAGYNAKKGFINIEVHQWGKADAANES